MATVSRLTGAFAEAEHFFFFGRVSGVMRGLRKVTEWEEMCRT